MSQRRAIVDRFGQPLNPPEEKGITREQIVQALNQLRQEMNALLKFNDTFYTVMEEKYPGVMAEVVRRIEAQIPEELREAKVQ